MRSVLAVFLDIVAFSFLESVSKVQHLAFSLAKTKLRQYRKTAVDVPLAADQEFIQGMHLAMEISMNGTHSLLMIYYSEASILMRLLF
jgi:hypothetical protein